MTSTSFFSNKNDKKLLLQRKLMKEIILRDDPKLLLKILEEWDKITDIEFLEDVQNIDLEDEN